MNRARQSRRHPTRRRTMQAQAKAPSALPSAAVVVSHHVEDFAAWKRVFDRHAAARRSAGITATHVNQDAEDPNSLSVYMAATDRAKLADFLAGVDLMKTMRDAGVTGPPLIADITPVEDLTRKDRALAGLIVRHEVRDYAAWKQSFDEHAEARRQAGIIGHAVN